MALKPRTLIFDIDDTLITTRERKITALNRVASLPNMKHTTNIQCIANLDPETAPEEYGIEKALAACHIPSDAINDIRAHWLNIFLSNDGMYKDGKVLGKPTKGALNAVKLARSKGFDIIYLTGRHHDPAHNDSMLQGTMDELQTYGFPLDDHAQLIMKTKQKYGDTVAPLVRMTNDAEYKYETLKKLKKNHHIVATFDDGFKNVEIFRQNLPEATHFGLTTNFPCEKFPSGTMCVSSLDHPFIYQFLQNQ